MAMAPTKAERTRVDRTIGVDKEIHDDVYILRLATLRGWSNNRVLKDVACNLVHKLHAEDVTNDSLLDHKVQRDREGGERREDMCDYVQQLTILSAFTATQ